MSRPNRRRPGDWLTADAESLRKWILNLKDRAAGTGPDDYVVPIRELQTLVEENPILRAATEAMFVEAIAYAKDQPTGAPAVTGWHEFLQLLNAVMTIAPEFIVDKGSDEAQGLVGFPINAILDWPMGTASGITVFQDKSFNAGMKGVLTYWSQFLTSEPSRYVLAENDPASDPAIIAWLSAPAREQMVSVAQQPFPNPPKGQTLEDIFAVPDPSDPTYLGYTSWDDFFTRVFKEGQRPVGDAVLVNACESAPLQVRTGVELEDNIWAKGQPYSLSDMLNGDPLAPAFAGGTVYQAFLSALSYHRWHSPVDGTIEKVANVDGAYYLESPWEGIYSDEPDPSAPNASQPFITSVAARAVIFIRADDPAIGLMAMVPVGMAEVSSCEVTVKAGDRVKRGNQVGMFHFGGSTHCLVFRKGVELDFHVPITDKPNLDATNVAVRSNLASLK